MTAKQSLARRRGPDSTSEIEEAIQPGCRIAPKKKFQDLSFMNRVKQSSLLCTLSFTLEEIADCLGTDAQQLGCLGLIVAGQFHGPFNIAASGL